MNRILLAAWLISFSFAANAGPALEKFKQDVNAYLSAQAENPNKVIKYSDAQGEIARAVLNPARIQSVVAETREEINGTEQLKAAFDLYKQVALKYATAFEQLHGKYDEEFLDSFEVMVQMALAGMRPLQNLKLEDIQDESLRPVAEAAIKMASAIPTLLLQMLKKNIDDGKFSSSFTPTANARLQALQAASKLN